MGTYRANRYKEGIHTSTLTIEEKRWWGWRTVKRWSFNNLPNYMKVVFENGQSPEEVSAKKEQDKAIARLIKEGHTVI